MTRLLKTTACALVSSILFLAPAVQATHGLHHNNINDNNAAAAGTEAKHGHHQRHFHVREVRFSPFIVDSSKELNKALAILEHESQQCNDAGRRRHRHHNHHDNDDDANTAGANRKQGGLRNRKYTNAAGSNNNHHNNDHHGHKEDEDEERCFGRIKLVKGGTFQLDREFIFADAFKLDLEGHPGATIRAAPGQRHLTFDDEAVLNAHQVAFVDGGCDKEGFVGGSILLVNRASLFARGVNWTNNHAWSGGAVFADDAKRLNVFHGVFKDNSADRKGGAVAIREAHGNRNNKHDHQDNNDDDDNEVGAAGNKNKANEAVQKRRREAEERRKKQQTARAANNKNKNKNGGNVAGANEDNGHGHHHGHKRQRRRVSRVKFVRVKFAKNTANKGGAIWNDGSHTEVEDSFFFKNKAHLGGAIFNAKHGRLLVRETAFVENEASAKGGAIFNDGWLWVVCSAFVDNQAPLGCDIFNNGWLKCTSETIPVKIDGNGHGYCTPCTQPQTAAPTVRSTPMRRVKKAEVVEKKHHGHHDDKDNGNRGGLFGGLWNKNRNQDGPHNEAAETRVFYDYYRHGEGNAYDRWNGYNSALVEEEEAEDFNTGYGYGASGYGSYGASGWAGGAGAGAGNKKQKEGGADSYYGEADESYYGDEEGYYAEAEGAEEYYGVDDTYYGGQEAYGYAEPNEYTYYGDGAAGQAYGSTNYAA